MTAFQIYLRKGVVFVPTVARTEAGYYMGIEPLRVVPVDDSAAVQAAIKDAMSAGNPIVPTPTRANFPESNLLKYAKVRSWSAFEKNALNWTIDENAGIYKICPGRRHPEGGWEDDPERIETLPADATIEQVARRVAALLADAAASDS